MTPELHRQAAEELTGEIADLHARIAKLELVLSWHTERLDIENDVPDEVGTVDETGGEEKLPPLNFKGKTQAEAIVAIMQRSQAMLRPAEVVDELQAGGWRPDQDRAALLNSTYTTMKRRDDLFFKEDSEWGLRGTTYIAESPNGAP